MNQCFRQSPALTLLFVALLPTTVPVAAGGAPTAVTVSGQVVLPATEDPSRWRVLLSRKLWPLLPQAQGTLLRAGGAFTVTAPVADHLFVCAYADGVLDVETVLPVRPEKPVEAKLEPTAPRTAVTFALQRQGGAPLGSEVKVYLFNAHGAVTPQPKRTDENGRVTFERLPCTYYDLWIEPTPEQSATLPAALFRSLSVSPGDGALSIPLTVPQAGGIRGKLLLADGKTPAANHVISVQTGTVPNAVVPASLGAAAYARGALNCYAETVVAADGSFALAGLTPGKLVLDVRRPGEPGPWCSLPAGEVIAGNTANLGEVRVSEQGWRFLFDRESLTGWTESDFWGKSDVRVENDRLVMERGNDMTGVTWIRDLPRIDYEVTLQAMRVAHEDFFCGLTFPVKKDPCTLIMGGWGGGVVGLSSLDDMDASENETSNWIKFENRRWYRVRLRVRPNTIRVWLDNKPLIDADLRNRRVGIRLECEPSVPFGIATWCTTGAIRDLRIRKLELDELREDARE